MEFHHAKSRRWAPPIRISNAEGLRGADEPGIHQESVNEIFASFDFASLKIANEFPSLFPLRYSCILISVKRGEAAARAAHCGLKQDYRPGGRFGGSRIQIDLDVALPSFAIGHQTLSAYSYLAFFVCCDEFF